LRAVKMIPERDVDRQNLGKAVARSLKRRRIRTSNLYFIAAITWIHRHFAVCSWSCKNGNPSSEARVLWMHFYSFGFFILRNSGYFTCAKQGPLESRLISRLKKFKEIRE
jgi:hypothetical protein